MNLQAVSVLQIAIDTLPDCVEGINSLFVQTNEPLEFNRESRSNMATPNRLAVEELS